VYTGLFSDTGYIQSPTSDNLTKSDKDLNVKLQTLHPLIHVFSGFRSDLYLVNLALKSRILLSLGKIAGLQSYKGENGIRRYIKTRQTGIVAFPSQNRSSY
jgi:hypothetical protein